MLCPSTHLSQETVQRASNNTSRFGRKYRNWHPSPEQPCVLKQEISISPWLNRFPSGSQHRSLSCNCTATASMTNSHYDNVADHYEKAFFYSSPEYQKWILGHLLVELNPGMPIENTQTDTDSQPPACRPTALQDLYIADIGGGTGNFTQALAAALEVQRPALCIDPYGPMLELAGRHPLVDTLQMDAVQFATSPDFHGNFSHMLLKEVVHHIPVSEYQRMFGGLFEQLRPGGIVVIITRPQEVSYPLFALARKVWKENQPSQEEIAGALSSCGFTVHVTTQDYHAQLPKATWFSMVRDRFWSTFSHMSDEQLEAGLQEVEAEYVGQDNVTFVDRLLFIVGVKSS